MTQLYNFPGPDTRQSIHNIMMDCARGNISHYKMERAVSMVMMTYSVTSLKVKNYTVKLYDGERQPIVIVEVEGMHDHCPVCEACPDNAGYVRTAAENLPKDKDTVTVFCLECGTIYNTGAEYDWKGVTKC